MSVPHLPNVASNLARLTESLESAEPGRDAIWHIDGPPTAGKSTLLHLLDAELRQQGSIPIYVSPPPQALDTGAVALAEIGSGLKDADMLDGNFERLQDPKVKWLDKLSFIREAVEQNCARLVLLCDEPNQWPSPMDREPHFSQRARSVASLLLDQVTCKRVVTGQFNEARQVQKFYVHAGSDPEDWLADAGNWGDLGNAAKSLLKHCDVVDLRRLSPLSLRLLVAIAELDQSSDALQRGLAESRRDISRRLAEVISSNPQLQPLQRVWGALALLRRPIDQKALAIAGESTLPPLARSILKSCLLYEQDGMWVMHDMLKRDAYSQEWLSDEQNCEWHATFAQHYTRTFSEAVNDGETSALLREQMEAYHHATESRQRELVAALKPYFVDQLDVWGRVLSHDMFDYEGAVEVFEQAVKWDDEDDYAHHYYAYNLDVQGIKKDEVQAHYEKAIDLDSRHPWWRSRYINFLVTVGRMKEARRAWADALDALSLPNPSESSHVYRNLHLWVARLLIHRGQLDFVRGILDGIPQHLVEADPGLASMKEHLDALVEARDRRAVFPLTVRPALWWDGGPHISSRKGLREWLPGRIDSVDAEGVHIHTARRPPQEGAEPQYGFLTIGAARFTACSEDEDAGSMTAGRFIEIAYYERDDDPVIRIHPQNTWLEREMPPLRPDPARYLRKSGRLR